MKKNKNNFQQRKNTTQFQLTIRFISLLVATVLILSITFITITISEIYESTEEQAAVLENSLKNREAKSVSEWQRILSSYVSRDNSPYYIHVGLASGEIAYSSEDAKKIYDEFSEFKQLALFDQLLWSREFEPYFYTSIQNGETKITILVDMEDQFEVVSRIFSLTLFITGLVIVAGSLVTYRFSKKLSGSLVRMNQEISDMEDFSNERLLTVPETPQEVQNVSKSFNQLLEKQRQSLKREQQFVTDASHELRTPLAAIRGHVNLIKRRGEKHPEVIPTSLAYIDKESKRMEILAEQLLTLGRLETQVGEEMIDLSALVRQTLNDLTVMIKQKVTVQIDDGITIQGNQDHFYQIIRNLIENAVKYTPDSGSIVIKLLGKEKSCTLIVEDSGVGIADEEKEHIFERFYRVDQSRSSEVPGSGIGLSIVKELASLYDGTIEVTDVLPQGSRFTIEFKK